MKLLYLAHIRLPTEKAHGAQIMKTCEALAREGVEVELVAPGRKTTITEDPFSYYGVERNFTCTFLNTPDVVPLGAFGFPLSLLWFSEVAKWRKSFWSADVIYSRDAGVLLQYILLGRELVYEAHMRPTFISRCVARRAYRVVAISEGLRDAYVRAGVKADRICVAHDAVDSVPFQMSYSKEEVQKEYRVPGGKKIVLYVGKIDEAKGVPILAEASEYVPDDTQVVIIGSGTSKASLVRRYPKALFLSETPYKDLPRILSMADVLVIPNSAKNTDASLYTSPLKAFAYLASRKPIVASDVPALREIFTDGVSFFTPDDPRALAQAVLVALGREARGDVPVYSWDERARAILNAIE